MARIKNGIKQKKKKDGTTYQYTVNPKTNMRGIPAEKKSHILQKLGNLMPESRKIFFKELPTSDEYDLIDQI